MKNSLIVVALASAIFGGVLAEAKPAAAWWTRQYGGTLTSYLYGQRVYGSIADYPVVSNSSMPASSAVAINVEVYNLRSDTNTSIEICAAHWAGASQTCSALQTQSGVGHKTFDFAADEATWNTVGNFPYVHAYAYNNALVVADDARVSGIFVSN